MTQGVGSLGRRYEADRNVTEMSIHSARRLLAGVHPRDVVETGGISLRTAYRWRRELVAIEAVTVDGWTATFARFRYRAPVRISAWERLA